jgi:hypothetical protein
MHVFLDDLEICNLPNSGRRHEKPFQKFTLTTLLLKNVYWILVVGYRLMVKQYTKVVHGP